jgi:hypothetical protein
MMTSTTNNTTTHIRANTNPHTTTSPHHMHMTSTSKIRESKVQNLNYEQDLRITKYLDLTAKDSKMYLRHPNLHKCSCKYWVNTLFKRCFTFKKLKTYQDMFNEEFNYQNIFKHKSSKIANTYFFPGKNQARLSIIFFIPSKNQARQLLLEKAQSRSRREF